MNNATKFCFSEYELQRMLQLGVDRYNHANDSAMLYWNGYSEALRSLLDLGRSRNALAAAAEEGLMFKTASLKLLNDEPEPRLGAGISRPWPNQKVKEHTVMVRHPKSRPMRVVLLAPNINEAVKYAQNRWPAATVEAALKDEGSREP